MLAEIFDEALQDQLTHIDKKSVIKVTERHTITIHTKFAQSLLNGSWQLGKMGLFQFAKCMSDLIKAKKADDPYAEWYLLQTYKAIVEANKTLTELEAKAQSYLQNLRGITVSLWQGANPVKLPLQFTNPFSFLTAHSVIANCDYVARQIMTLDELGIIYNKDVVSRRHIKALVQNVFSISRKWKKTDLTRQDIKDGNLKAQQAKEMFGDIPDSILNEEVTLSIMPKSKKLEK